jgi:hypothetical protein
MASRVISAIYLCYLFSSIYLFNPSGLHEYYVYVPPKKEDSHGYSYFLINFSGIIVVIKVLRNM